jgi:hypothetical protein
MRRFLHWLGERLRDLFYSTGNRHLDLARVTAAVLSAVAVFAVLWNSVHLGKEIDLGATIGGLAALATALNLGIAAKEWARSKFKGENAVAERDK